MAEKPSGRRNDNRQDIAFTKHPERSKDHVKTVKKQKSEVIDDRHSTNQQLKPEYRMKKRHSEAREPRQPDLNPGSSFGSSGTNKKRVKRDTDSEKPNFGLSGKLTEDTNTYKGVVIRYTEPPEARKPKKKWRLYPFKGETALPVLHLHRQSAFLIGRDRRIADIPSDHPSCSKQHAVLQFRMVEFSREDGTTGRRVRPYIIDLGSANGTFVNNSKIEPERYVELLERDVLKFGYSTREYVVLLDTSDTAVVEDDDC